jgi:hypothetical protein
MRMAQARKNAEATLERKPVLAKEKGSDFRPALVFRVSRTVYRGEHGPVVKNSQLLSAFRANKRDGIARPALIPSIPLGNLD